MEVSKAINAIEITVELNLFPNVKKVFGRWKTIQNVILNGLQSWYIIITLRNVKLRNFLLGFIPQPAWNFWQMLPIIQPNGCGLMGSGE